jgi:hypothetical protein
MIPKMRFGNWSGAGDGVAGMARLASPACGEAGSVRGTVWQISEGIDIHAKEIAT